MKKFSVEFYRVPLGFKFRHSGRPYVKSSSRTAEYVNKLAPGSGRYIVRFRKYETCEVNQDVRDVIIVGEAAEPAGRTVCSRVAMWGADGRMYREATGTAAQRIADRLAAPSVSEPQLMENIRELVDASDEMLSADIAFAATPARSPAWAEASKRLFRARARLRVARGVFTDARIAALQEGTA